MTVNKITFAKLINDYAVVETLTNAEVVPGQAITIASVAAGFNGAQTVYAVPQYFFMGVDSDGDLLYNTNIAVPNQVLFYSDSANVDRYAVIPQGTLTYTQTCTWIDGTAVSTWLGIALAGVDETAFLAQCATAAGNFIYLRRQEAGYTDSLTTCSTQITLATTMFAGALYRQRGAIDNFSSFGDMGTAVASGLSPLIKQLAGIPRPAVA